MSCPGPSEELKRRMELLIAGGYLPSSATSLIVGHSDDLSHEQYTLRFLFTHVMREQRSPAAGFSGFVRAISEFKNDEAAAALATIALYHKDKYVVKDAMWELYNDETEAYKNQARRLAELMLDETTSHLQRIKEDEEGVNEEPPVYLSAFWDIMNNSPNLLASLYEDETDQESFKAKMREIAELMPERRYDALPGAPSRSIIADMLLGFDMPDDESLDWLLRRIREAKNPIYTASNFIAKLDNDDPRQRTLATELAGVTIRRLAELEGASSIRLDNILHYLDYDDDENIKAIRSIIEDESRDYGMRTTLVSALQLAGKNPEHKEEITDYLTHIATAKDDGYSEIMQDNALNAMARIGAWDRLMAIAAGTYPQISQNDEENSTDDRKRRRIPLKVRRQAMLTLMVNTKKGDEEVAGFFEDVLKGGEKDLKLRLHAIKGLVRSLPEEGSDKARHEALRNYAPAVIDALISPPARMSYPDTREVQSFLRLVKGTENNEAILPNDKLRQWAEKEVATNHNAAWTNEAPTSVMLGIAADRIKSGGQGEDFDPDLMALAAQAYHDIHTSYGGYGYRYSDSRRALDEIARARPAFYQQMLLNVIQNNVGPSREKALVEIGLEDYGAFYEMALRASSNGNPPSDYQDAFEQILFGQDRHGGVKFTKDEITQLKEHGYEIPYWYKSYYGGEET